MAMNETRDKEKTFKQAHQKLKRVVLDAVGAHRTLVSGGLWCVTKGETARIPGYHRGAVQLALQEIVIAFDMMRDINRESMKTVQEVVANTDSLLVLAQWACERDVLFQTVGQATPSRAASLPRTVSRSRSASPRPSLQQSVPLPPTPVPSLGSRMRSVSTGGHSTERDYRSPTPRLGGRFLAGLRV